MIAKKTDSIKEMKEEQGRKLKGVLPDLEMVYVEGGTFEMGSKEKDAFDFEKPVHLVKLSSYYMAKYPVTQALWGAVLGEGNNPSFFKGDRRPVEQVSWKDTQTFIEKLNGKTGKKYRLPTEAEWEYAARGGKKGRNKDFLYAGGNKLKEVGWCGENSYQETKVVCILRPNILGLFDMCGNVREWCHDYFSFDYYKECYTKDSIENPLGPSIGITHVIRGGGWDNYARYCRCTYRINWPSKDGNKDVGFRLVLPIN